MYVAVAAPKNATIESAKGPKGLVNQKIEELTITIKATAVTAAPLETPISPGSARGLRKSPCMTAPETAKPPPTSKPSNTLGNQIATITASCVLLNSQPKFQWNKCSQIMAMICAGVIVTAPIPRQSMQVPERITVRVTTRIDCCVVLKRVINFQRY